MLENTKESVKRVKSEARKWVRGSERLLFLFLVISLAKFLNIERKPKTRKKKKRGNCLAVWCLGLGAFTAVGPGLIPVGELRSHKCAWLGKKKRRKEGTEKEKEEGGRKKEKEGVKRRKREKERKEEERKKNEGRKERKGREGREEGSKKLSIRGKCSK